MSTIFTVTIPETDCIGDSLDTINNNFDKLGTAVTTVSSTVNAFNVADTPTVDLSFNNTTRTLSASVVAGSISTLQLSAGAVGAVQLSAGAVTAAKLNGGQSGLAPIYGCRAWVNFDGTRDASGAASTANTNRFIRSSGNVSSVLRTSTGDYTVNFAIPMADANYSIAGTLGATAGQGFVLLQGFSIPPTTAGVRMLASNGTSNFDTSLISVQIFGN